MTPSVSKLYAQIRPSASKRWMACPGSATLEAQKPWGPSGVYAKEGSAIHLLGEMRLKKVLTAQGLTKTRGKRIKDIAPELNARKNDFLDVVITEEMIWIAQEYILFVESLLPPGASTISPCVKVEQKVVTAVHRDLSGTVDAMISHWPMILHVVDLKTGGNQIEAEGNSQLAIYALGAMELFGYDFDTVAMHIFQPRGAGETIRTWEVPLKEFRAEWTAKLEKSIHRVVTQKTTYIPGPHCMWCKGAFDCTKAKGATLALANANTSLSPPDNPDELANILNLEIPILEYLNQCKARATALLHKGIPVPGFKLVKTWGREKWTGKTSDIGLLLHAIGLEPMEYQKIELRTPKQIRNALKDRYPEELDKLTTTPMNGVKLVPETDKRPAFLPAAEVFTDD